MPWTGTHKQTKVWTRAHQPHSTPAKPLAPSVLNCPTHPNRHTTHGRQRSMLGSAHHTWRYLCLNTWSVGLQCVCTTGFEYIGLQCAQWWTCTRKWCHICSLYMFSAATSANVSHPAEEGHNSHWHKPHTRSWFQFMVQWRRASRVHVPRQWAGWACELAGSRGEDCVWLQADMTVRQHNIYMFTKQTHCKHIEYFKYFNVRWSASADRSHSWHETWADIGVTPGNPHCKLHWSSIWLVVQRSHIHHNQAVRSSGAQPVDNSFRLTSAPSKNILYLQQTSGETTFECVC